MAKKTTKKTTKKAASKKTAKKPSAKKAPAKKAASKTTAKKPAAKKPAAKKPAAKKTAAKKPTAKKPPAKKAPAKTSKKTSKKTESKAPAKAETKADTKPAAKTDAKSDAKGEDGKPARKGITIVDKKKTMRRPAPKKYELPKPKNGGLAAMLGKPLIASGPKAPKIEVEEETETKSRRRKSPYNKRQLDKYKDLLILKRRELLGDIDAMEGEALKSDSGSLSSTPQHAADQGSDAYDQSLSLELAAADRETIREIDAALDRIAEGTYGLCEVTHEPIGDERLESLPWARLSIKAAEAADRRRYGR